MTLTKFLDLLEQITRLPTKRACNLFEQNVLKPLQATENDNRMRDLVYSLVTRRNYLSR
jgi:hypothetical protein